jgi:hypothetical protein
MRRSAIAGGAVWIGLAAASRMQGARLNTIELLFLLGPLVVVPLGLGLSSQFTGEAQIGFPIRIARKLQLPAALCAVASFWLPQGVVATILVLPWLVLGCFVGLEGLMALLRGEFGKLKTACRIVSFLYLPIGCAWLAASRFGLSPMSFQEPIVLLTAVHFHFAGFAAPLLALAAGSAIEKKTAMPRHIFNVVAAGILAGPGLLAAGFVIGPRLKLAMALLVACSEVGLSLFFLAHARSMRPRLAQVLVTISALSVLFAMVLAGVWAIGEFPLQPFVHLDEMARFHGTANALGFILCGLVGWTLAARPTAAPQQGGIQ